MDGRIFIIRHVAAPRAPRLHQLLPAPLVHKAVGGAVIRGVGEQVAAQQRVHHAILVHGVGGGILHLLVGYLAKTVRTLTVGHAFADTAGQIQRAYLAHGAVHGSRVLARAAGHTRGVHKLFAVLVLFQNGEHGKSATPSRGKLGEVPCIRILDGRVPDGKLHVGHGLTS